MNIKYELTKDEFDFITGGYMKYPCIRCERFLQEDCLNYSMDIQCPKIKHFEELKQLNFSDDVLKLARDFYLGTAKKYEEVDKLSERIKELQKEITRFKFNFHVRVSQID